MYTNICQLLTWSNFRVGFEYRTDSDLKCQVGVFGSVLIWLSLRIHVRNLDPDPRARKLAKIDTVGIN
jgi:hypothetical protein